MSYTMLSTFKISHWFLSNCPNFLSHCPIIYLGLIYKTQYSINLLLVVALFNLIPADYTSIYNWIGPSLYYHWVKTMRYTLGFMGFQ